jgi:hypothetical protein
VFVLALQVNFVHFLQFLLPPYEAEQSAHLLIANLQPLLGFGQSVDFLLEPVTLVEIVVDGGLVALEGTIPEVLRFLLGFLVFLGKAVLLACQFVVLLFELSHLTRQLLRVLNCFSQQLLDVLDAFLALGQLELGDVQHSLLFAQLYIKLLQLSPQSFLPPCQFVVVLLEVVFS